MKDIVFKDIVKIVTILSVIAIIAGALLGIMYVVTKVDTEAQLVKEINEQFPELAGIEKVNFNDGINPMPDAAAAKGSILNVFKSNDNTYIFHSTGKGGYGGDVQLLIAIKDNRIVKILVYSASETPGVGAAVLEGKYMEQFKNVDIKAFEGFSLTKPQSGELKKYFDGAAASEKGEVTGSVNGEVVAVTGATKTSNAVLNAVNCAVYTYKSLTGGSR